MQSRPVLWHLEHFGLVLSPRVFSALICLIQIGKAKTNQTYILNGALDSTGNKFMVLVLALEQ